IELLGDGREGNHSAGRPFEQDGDACAQRTFDVRVEEEGPAKIAPPPRPELGDEGRFARGLPIEQAFANPFGEENVCGPYICELVWIAENSDRLGIERDRTQRGVQQEEANRRPGSMPYARLTALGHRERM